MNKRGNPNRPQQAARGGPNQTPQLTGAPAHLRGRNLDRGWIGDADRQGVDNQNRQWDGDPNRQGAERTGEFAPLTSRGGPGRINRVDGTGAYTGQGESLNGQIDGQTDGAIVA